MARLLSPSGVLVRCATEDDYRRRTVDKARSRGATLIVMGLPLIAYANHGRWVADCVCRSGIELHPEWRFAACWECFRTYTDVRWPEDVTGIEDALRRRGDTRHQNWLPGERVDDLLREGR